MSLLISPSVVIRLDGDVPSTSTLLADVTGLTWPVVANADYLFEAFLVYVSTAAATGINLGINGPAGATVVGNRQAFTAAAVLSSLQVTALNAGTATGTVATANVPQFATLAAMMHTVGTAGDATLRFASETGTQVVVKAGSILRVQQLAPVSTVNTLERFYAVVQLTQNLATMSRNMRSIVQQVKAYKDAGRLVGTPPHVMTFEDAQTSIRNTGQSFLDRLAANAAVITPHPTEVSDGAATLGIVMADMAARYTLLLTWATTMHTATITNQTELDNGVAAILAAIPDTILVW